MPGYLLLRDNKESGPHTLEEMIAKQLKQHDLIWVDGRSAAWRYPEELEEFKKYITISPAGATENTQPVAVNEKYQHPALKNTVIPEQHAYVQASDLSKNEQPVPRDRAAKYISVIFPNTVKQAPEKRQPDTTPVPTEKAVPVTAKEKIIVEEEITPNFSAGSFSAGFPERKLMAPVTQDRSFTIAKNLIWGIAILLGGVVLGLSLGNIFTTKPGIPVPKESVAQQNVLPAPPQDDPVLNTSTTEAGNGFVASANEPEQPVEVPLKKKPLTKSIDVPLTDEASTEKTNPVADNTPVNSIPVNNSTAVNEEKEKEKAKTDIRNLLSVTNNKFKIGAFGGINELQISVTNNSHYPVDVVAVDVQYMLVNKKVYKTETLYFRDLRPGVTLMQNAPKSSRGVTVEYAINAVNSKALGL